jgi:hypothetical protein
MPGTEPPINPNSTASHTDISHQLFHAASTNPTMTTRNT